MKRNLKNNWPTYILIMLLSFASCSQGHNHAEEADTYTCPMHPTVISDRPGTCPVCGMDLVRKARPGEEVEITEDLAKLIKSPNETVVASVKTIKPQYRSVPASVEVQGVVTYDTRNLFTISSRIAGRLDKVYLKYEFQPVTKGQKVAEIYSPELITAQRELLFLVENDPNNKGLIDAATNKLSLLGLTDSQIADLRKHKSVSSTFTVHSPYSGYLTTGVKVPSTTSSVKSPSSQSSGMKDDMGTISSSAQDETSQQQNTRRSQIIHEGTYVSAGQILFNIVNTAALRIELDIPSASSGSIKEKDQIELDLGTGAIEKASVDFVQPFFNEGEDFMKIRVYTKNVEQLHIGQLVAAKIKLAPGESLWVTKESVLDLGNEKIVFVKEKGLLKPKKVVTGISSADLIEIKSGLASQDEIAANAQYLVDSESFIKSIK